jgi:hypothetical protein
VRGGAGAPERRDRREREWSLDRQWTLKVDEVHARSLYAEGFAFPDEYADGDTFVVQVPDRLL